MKWNKAGFVFFILATVVLLSPVVQANVCEVETYANFNYETAIKKMQTLCFELDNNSTALGVKLKDILKTDSSDDPGPAVLALSAIQAHLTETYIGRETSQSNNAKALHEAIRKLIQDIKQNPEGPVADFKIDWKLGRLDRLPEALKQMNFKGAPFSDECDISTGNCNKEFKLAADIVGAIFLANAAIDKYTEDYQAKALQSRKRRRASWDSYYDDLTFQYPWELWTNSLLLDATDNRSVVDDNKIGFRTLPKNKLVLLHPEVNLVYVDDADDEYEVTVTVEMLGYEAFDFDSSGKIKNPWGVSLLAAYLDRTDRDDSGWTGGLLFKYNGYSLGVTDNHGDAGIVFNINLSQRLFEVKQESRRYYDEYKGNIEAFRQSLE